jgi:hypothetical protein
LRDFNGTTVSFGRRLRRGASGCGRFVVGWLGRVVERTSGWVLLDWAGGPDERAVVGIKWLVGRTTGVVVVTTLGSVALGLTSPDDDEVIVPARTGVTPKAGAGRWSKLDLGGGSSVERELEAIAFVRLVAKEAEDDAASRFAKEAVRAGTAASLAWARREAMVDVPPAAVLLLPTDLELEVPDAAAVVELVRGLASTLALTWRCCCSASRPSSADPTAASRFLVDDDAAWPARDRACGTGPKPRSLRASAVALLSVAAATVVELAPALWAKGQPTRRQWMSGQPVELKRPRVENISSREPASELPLARRCGEMKGEAWW